MKELRLIFRQPNTPGNRPGENADTAPQSSESLRSPEGARTEIQQRMRGARESAELGREALYADLDRQDRDLNQQLKGSGFEIRDDAEPRAEFEGRQIPSGESDVLNAGPKLRAKETALAQNQQQKREVQKYASTPESGSGVMVEAGWGPNERFGKTDGKQVYMYKKVNGELFAYTPRLGLQVQDTASGQWYYVYNLNGGKQSRGSRPGAMKNPTLDNIYLNTNDRTKMNTGPNRSTYDNNNYLEENFLKLSFKQDPASRIQFDQFVKNAPRSIWTDLTNGEMSANSEVFRRFNMLYSTSGAGVEVPTGQLDIRQQSGENVSSAQLEGDLRTQGNEVTASNKDLIEKQKLVETSTAKLAAITGKLNTMYGSDAVQSFPKPEAGTHEFIVKKDGKTFGLRMSAAKSTGSDTYDSFAMKGFAISPDGKSVLSSKPLGSVKAADNFTDSAANTFKGYVESSGEAPKQTEELSMDTADKMKSAMRGKIFAVSDAIVTKLSGATTKIEDEPGGYTIQVTYEGKSTSLRLITTPPDEVRIERAGGSLPTQSEQLTLTQAVNRDPSSIADVMIDYVVGTVYEIDYDKLRSR